MSLESEIENLTGIKISPPATTDETVVYDLLRNKRVSITLDFIPPALRDEFTTVIFPDRNLKLYARALYRNRELHSKAISELLTAHMRASINAGGFGQKLQQRGIRAEDMLIKMLAGV